MKNNKLFSFLLALAIAAPSVAAQTAPSKQSSAQTVTVKQTTSVKKASTAKKATTAKKPAATKNAQSGVKATAATKKITAKAASSKAASPKSSADTKALYGLTGAALNRATHNTSPQTYTVGGVTYTTKTSGVAKNYSKEGTASYYHAKFHGRKTSSGEMYDQTRFTAAHKTLPINSYAVVTNLRNNRKVVVRINDRGPFSNKRIIDLSRAAASELGMIASGVAKVRIEALHVDYAGRISGAGVETLAKSATDTSKLVFNKTKSADDDLNIAAANSAIAPKLESNDDGTNQYAVSMKNVKSRDQAEDLVEKLAMHNVPTEIKDNGKNYEVLFRSINDQADINRLKQRLNEIDKEQSIQVYTYNY